MPKVEDKILLEEIAADFCIYLKSGKFNFSSIVQKIDPNLSIDAIEKLLKIHFVLTKRSDNNKRNGVIDFVEKLSTRIRRIKTNVNKLKKLFRGEVRGKIAWRQTISLRYSQNPSNKTTYICNDNKRDYNIAENLVLKKLLQIIHSIVYNYLEECSDDANGWIEKWFGCEDDSQESLQETLKRLYLKNVYLKRIDLTKVQVTERMIDRAKQSRHALYREAAALLQRYRMLMNYEIDDSEAKELLRNTFIEPKKVEVLFELYWIIRIIKSLKNKEVKFKILEKGENTVATWYDDSYEYKIFHNNTGSLNFSVNWDEIIIPKLESVNKNDKSYITRASKVAIHWQKLSKELMKINASDSLWGGRPDILIEKYDSEENMQQIMIGEVKYTNDKYYIAQGLKELLEYMALIKDEKYIEDIDNLFEDNNHENVKGGLFVDNSEGIDIQNQKDKNVRIYMYGKNLESLEELF